MPDNMYFRQPATQNMMLDVLFIWCKMHPDIGYRQGMHEILAPVLWVMERDAVDMAVKAGEEKDELLVNLVDSSFIEHDSFTLFATAMETAQGFYAPAPEGAASNQTPMLARSARIFERYLSKVDPELAAHLVKLEIVPQIFLLRWIRLLFGREFPLDAVLDMWDALFAIDPTLELVDMISVAMLLRIRWRLVKADTNEAFSLLLRYPAPESPPYTFIKDALYLRDHLTPEGGAEIITRHGQKAPPIDHKAPEIRAPSPVPSPSLSKIRSAAASPIPRLSSPGGSGLETLIQTAARGVLDRGSQWNVGKAIRDAVGEVKKNVEAIQSASGQSTPRSGGREFRRPLSTGPARPALDRAQTGQLLKKIESLEQRNKRLAQMLESAVGELWDHHKEQAEGTKEKKKEEEGEGKVEGKDKAGLEALSLAIAKVQFVQVYLEDSSVPLPPAEANGPTRTPQTTPETEAEKENQDAKAAPLKTDTPRSSTPTTAPERTASAPPASPPPLGPTSTKEPNSRKSAELLSPSRASTALQATQPTTTKKERSMSPPTSPPRPRPLLSSPSFAWMLGPSSTDTDTAPRSAFAKASEHTPFASDEKRRMRGTLGKGFLFGDDEGVMESIAEGGHGKGGRRGSVGKSKKAKSGKVAKKEEVVMDGMGMGVEEEIINLEDVGKGAVW